jgi:signal transduction histidine kinase
MRLNLARVGIVLAALLILWLDSLTPIGFAIWLLYFLALLGAAYLFAKRGLLLFCVLCACCVVIGGFISKPSAVPPLFSIENRLSSVIILLTLGYVLHRSRQYTMALHQRAVELDQANRDLESFNYSVSHDLKNPLAVIRGFSRLLYDTTSAKLDKEECEWLARIVAESERMSEIMADLLRLASLGTQKLRRETVDLSQLARDSLAAVRGRSPHPAGDFIVQSQMVARADAGLLRLLFDNLIGNALKFSANVAHPRVEIGSYQQQEGTVFFVRDNGVGFDPSTAQRLFEPFVRLHTQREFVGTGIGLSIVRKIVERHDGRIWVQAQPGQGATFYFTLGRS